MKHFTRLAASAGIVALALAGCGGGGTSGGSGKAQDASSFKACAVSDAGGWNDKSFNESAYNGLKDTQGKLGIQINAAESSSDTDFAPNVESMVSDGCNLIIGVGFNLEQAIPKSANDNTDLHYALIDSSFSEGKETVTLKNGRPLLFNTAEAAYLAGYVAAGMTKTGKVATFGGIQIPSVTVFMDGFADGVAAYNKAKGTNVQLLGWDKASQNGSFTQSFDDQTLGKEQAQQTPSHTYVRDWDFIGTVDSWDKGVAHCTQRGKFNLGDAVEVLQPDGSVVTLTPEWIENAEGERVDATPHPMMQYTIPCATPLMPYSLLRMRKPE